MLTWLFHFPMQPDGVPGSAQAFQVPCRLSSPPIAEDVLPIQFQCTGRVGARRVPGCLSREPVILLRGRTSEFDGHHNNLGQNFAMTPVVSCS